MNREVCASTQRLYVDLNKVKMQRSPSARWNSQRTVTGWNWLLDCGNALIGSGSDVPAWLPLLNQAVWDTWPPEVNAGCDGWPGAHNSGWWCSVILPEREEGEGGAGPGLRQLLGLKHRCCLWWLQVWRVCERGNRVSTGGSVEPVLSGLFHLHISIYLCLLLTCHHNMHIWVIHVLCFARTKARGRKMWNELSRGAAFSGCRCDTRHSFIQLPLSLLHREVWALWVSQRGNELIQGPRGREVNTKIKDESSRGGGVHVVIYQGQTLNFL